MSDKIRKISDITTDVNAVAEFDQSIERLIESNKLWAYRMTAPDEAVELDVATHRQLLEADPDREDITYEVVPTLQ
jgi:hypothetical protein